MTAKNQATILHLPKDELHVQRQACQTKGVDRVQEQFSGYQMPLKHFDLEKKRRGGQQSNSLKIEHQR